MTKAHTNYIKLINNELRDKVYKNNLEHGFWDNVRPYDDFARNVLGEIEETLMELDGSRAPTEVYYKKGNKPEGAPTELADIIIFILDYFGGSDPKIDVDETFLETGDKFYKNEAHYEKVRKEKEPGQYFLEIRKECQDHISLSMLYHLLHGNDSFEVANGKIVSVSSELHAVIKLVLEFCEIYGIDMEKELIDKINYNNSRPKDYRKIGSPELLETDQDKVYDELVKKGWGMYKETDEVIQERQKINDEVLKKREERKKVAEEGDLDM